jgi:N-acetylneuraminic acid mutarotase
VADTSAVELFGELFVAGGRMVDGKATNVVEAYSPANDAWRTLPPLPIPVYGAAMVTDGSFLYLFGGADGQELFAAGYKFDPAGNGWQPIASLPGARANATAGVIAGNLYVVGGRDDQGALDTCAYYQPQEDSWHNCAPMLNPRAGAGTAVLVNKLYVVGGGLAGETILHSEAYDPNTDTWSLVNTPMLAEIPQWTGLGVTNVETKIYTIGGIRGESGLSNKTYVYTPFVYTTYIPAASNNGP